MFTWLFHPTFSLDIQQDDYTIYRCYYYLIQEDLRHTVRILIYSQVRYYRWCICILLNIYICCLLYISLIFFFFHTSYNRTLYSLQCIFDVWFYDYFIFGMPNNILTNSMFNVCFIYKIGKPVYFAVYHSLSIRTYCPAAAYCRAGLVHDWLNKLLFSKCSVWSSLKLIFDHNYCQCTASVILSKQCHTARLALTGQPSTPESKRSNSRVRFVERNFSPLKDPRRRRHWRVLSKRSKTRLWLVDWNFTALLSRQVAAPMQRTNLQYWKRCDYGNTGLSKLCGRSAD
jgi:hypothetical protein